MIGNLNIYRNKTPNLEVNRYAEGQICMHFQLVSLIPFSTLPSPPQGSRNFLHYFQHYHLLISDSYPGPWSPFSTNFAFHYLPCLLLIDLCNSSNNSSWNQDCVSMKSRMGQVRLQQCKCKRETSTATIRSKHML